MPKGPRGGCRPAGAVASRTFGVSSHAVLLAATIVWWIL